MHAYAYVLESLATVQVYVARTMSQACVEKFRPPRTPLPPSYHGTPPPPASSQRRTSR